MDNFLARAVALMLSLVAMAAGAVPASAGSSSMYRESGYQASTWWTQIDGTPRGSRFGNVHVGELWAYQVSKGTGDAFGWIDDFDCRRDAQPWGRGCRYVGSRFLEGYGLDFTVNRRLESASLSGVLIAYGGGHGSEGEVGRPVAAVTWTGIGDISRSRYSYRWSEDGATYAGSYRGTGRQAVMGGTMGPMGFDPERSGGWITSYSSRDQSRTR